MRYRAIEITTIIIIAIKIYVKEAYTHHVHGRQLLSLQYVLNRTGTGSRFKRPVSSANKERGRITITAPLEQRICHSSLW